MTDKLGELAALGAVFCWTVTSFSFEFAGKRVGSLAVNLIRLVLGALLLSLYCLASRGMPLPLDATPHQWTWLAVSGLIGFAVGDLCLFQAFVLIGARISMLLMSLVPPITAVTGWLIMGETLSPRDLTGMFLTIAGIAVVVLERNPGGRRVRLSHPVAGILLGLGGAAGQAVGLVLSKYGMQDYSAFAATQIRIFAGIAGFLVIVTVFRRWRAIGTALVNGRAMAQIFTGSVFGPFLGVSLSLVAVKFTAAGVASTIMAVVPVVIIAPAVLFFGERVTGREIGGACAAVAGVGLLFL